MCTSYISSLEIQPTNHFGPLGGKIGIYFNTLPYDTALPPSHLKNLNSNLREGFFCPFREKIGHQKNSFNPLQTHCQENKKEIRFFLVHLQCSKSKLTSFTNAILAKYKKNAQFFLATLYNDDFLGFNYTIGQQTGVRLISSLLKALLCRFNFLANYSLKRKKWGERIREAPQPVVVLTLSIN